MFVFSRTRKSFRNARWFALCLIVALWGCSSSGSSGGCGCSEPIPGGFPKQHRLNNIAQIKLTKKGVDFLKTNTSVLIKQFLPQGLEFDIPKSTSGSLEICRKHAKCKVTGKIRSLNLTLKPTKTIRADVRLDINTTAPRDIEVRVTQKVLGVKIRKTCKLRVTVANKAISTDITLNIDPVTKLLGFKIGSPSFSIDANRDFKIDGDVICKGLNLLKGLFKNLIEKEAKKAIGDALKDLNCMKCKTTAECGGGGAVCKDKVCRRGSACLAAPLGLEGQANVATLLGSFGNKSASKFMYSVKVGARADVKTTGIELGTLGGTYANPSPCAGIKTFPKLPPAPNFPFPATAPDGKTYMAGIGISQVMLTQAGRDAYRSGMLCVKVDEKLNAQVGQFLKAQTIGGLVSPSLLQLVGTDNPAMHIALRPGAPMAFEIGKGVITKDAKGNPVVKEPLLLVKIPKLGFDFMMFYHDRWMRLFTYRVDVVLPMAIEARPGNKLGLIMGELSKALVNPKVENSNVLSEDPKDMAKGLQNLLNTVMPLLVGAIGSPEFELPELQGFQLLLRGLTGQVPRKDRADRFQFLGLFADLKLAPPGKPQMPEQELFLKLLNVKIPPTLEDTLLARKLVKEFPKVTVAISNPDPALEYAVRINNGHWHPFSPNIVRDIESAQFLMQGKHTIHIRARNKKYPQAFEWSKGKIQVNIDYTKPKLKVTQSHKGIFFKTSDNVTANKNLQVVYQLTDGSWQNWKANTLLPASMLPANTIVSVRVRDEAGNEGLTRVFWHKVIKKTDIQNPTQQRIEKGSAEGNPAKPQVKAGCHILSGSDGKQDFSSTFFALLLCLGWLIVSRRRI